MLKRIILSFIVICSAMGKTNISFANAQLFDPRDAVGAWEGLIKSPVGETKIRLALWPNPAQQNKVAGIAIVNEQCIQAFYLNERSVLEKAAYPGEYAGKQIALISNNSGSEDDEIFNLQCLNERKKETDYMLIGYLSPMQLSDDKQQLVALYGGVSNQDTNCRRSRKTNNCPTSATLRRVKLSDDLAEIASRHQNTYMAPANQGMIEFLKSGEIYDEKAYANRPAFKKLNNLKDFYLVTSERFVRISGYSAQKEEGKYFFDGRDYNDANGREINNKEIGGRIMTGYFDIASQTLKYKMVAHSVFEQFSNGPARSTINRVFGSNKLPRECTIVDEKFRTSPGFEIEKSANSDIEMYKFHRPQQFMVSACGRHSMRISGQGMHLETGTCNDVQCTEYTKLDLFHFLVKGYEHANYVFNNFDEFIGHDSENRAKVEPLKFKPKEVKEAPEDKPSIKLPSTKPEVLVEEVLRKVISALELEPNSSPNHIQDKLSNSLENDFSYESFAKRLVEWRDLKKYELQGYVPQLEKLLPAELAYVYYHYLSGIYQYGVTFDNTNIHDSLLSARVSHLGQNKRGRKRRIKHTLMNEEGEWKLSNVTFSHGAHNFYSIMFKKLRKLLKENNGDMDAVLKILSETPPSEFDLGQITRYW